MAEQQLRLGDLVDDYCVRCRLLLNHAVASMMDGQVVKVICQTCFTEHAYRHGEGGKKKVPPRTTLFDQVLAKAAPEPSQLDEPQLVEEAPPVPVKRKGPVARYISRHSSKVPRKAPSR